ncbi:MAG: hypothetical protein U0792_05475 [Gemmataceae bacterium]
MTREELSAKALELARAVKEFDGWEAESARPRTVEVEFDDVWKLAVVWEEGFQTIKIHQRLEHQP